MTVDSTPAGLPPAGRCDGIAGDAETSTGPPVTADDIDARLRINDVTYVALEGGKGCRGSVMRLSTYRAEMAKANAEARR